MTEIEKAITAAAKKPASTTKKKKTSTAKKKTGTAKKKTASSIRLTAAEKKLVQNYRKGNLIEKKILDIAAEKFAEGVDASAVLNLLRGILG